MDQVVRRLTSSNLNKPRLIYSSVYYGTGTSIIGLNGDVYIGGHKQVLGLGMGATVNGGTHGSNALSGMDGSSSSISSASGNGGGRGNGGSDRNIYIYAASGSGISTQELRDIVAPQVQRIFDNNNLPGFEVSVISEVNAPKGYYNNVNNAVVPVRNSGDNIGFSSIWDGRNENYGNLDVDATYANYSAVKKTAKDYNLDKYYVLAYTIAHEALHQYITRIKLITNTAYPLGGFHYNDYPNLNKDGYEFNETEFKTLRPPANGLLSPQERIFNLQAYYIRHFFATQR